MEIAPSAVDAGEQLRLDRIGTEKLFSTLPPNGAAANSLIVCSSTYGLFFVASNCDIKALSTQQLAEHFINGSDLTAVSFAVPQPIQALCLNSDESLFAIVAHSNTHGSFVYLYEIGVFNPALNVTPRPFTDIRLTSAGDEYAVELQFNPVISNSFACVSSTGAITIRELLDANSSGYRITASVQNANAAAICWSPKGKQLCFITRDNSAIIQIKPDGGPARRIELPPTDLMRDPAPTNAAKKIIWLSTYEFLLNTQTNPNDRQYSLLHVIAPKDMQQLRVLNYHDVCFGSDDWPYASWYYSLIPQWGLLLATSNSSVEVAVLRNENNFSAAEGTVAKWQQLTPDDTCRAELPYDDDGQNSVGVPCGIAVDWSNSMTNDGTEPYVLWLTTSGALHVYKLTYMPNNLLAAAGLQRVPSLRSSGPVQQPLPGISARQQQVLSAAPIVQLQMPIQRQPAMAVPSFMPTSASLPPQNPGGNSNLLFNMLQQPEKTVPPASLFGAASASTPLTTAAMPQQLPTAVAKPQQPLFSVPPINNGFGGAVSSAATIFLPQPTTSSSLFAPTASAKVTKPIENSLISSTSGPSVADQQQQKQNAAQLASELEKTIAIVDKFGQEFRTVTHVIANESIFADAEQVNSAFGTQHQSTNTVSITELYNLVKPFDHMLNANDKRLREIGDRVVKQAADVDAVLAQLDVWLIALQAQNQYGGSMFAQLLRQQPPSQYNELRQYRCGALQRAISSNENVLNRLHAELDNAFALYGVMNHNDTTTPVLSLSGQPLPPNACKQLLRTTRRALKLDMLLQRVDVVRKAITIALETYAGLNSHVENFPENDAASTSTLPTNVKKSNSEVAGRREWLGMLNEYRQLVIQAREKLHATHAENTDDVGEQSRNGSGGGIEKLASRLSKLDFGSSSSHRKPHGFSSNAKQHRKSMQQNRPAWLVQLLRTRINDEDCSTVPCSYADEGATALVDAYKKSVAAVSADSNAKRNLPSMQAAQNDAESSHLTLSMTRLCELQETLVRNIQQAALSNNVDAAVSAKPPSRTGSTQPLASSSASLFSTPSKNLSVMPNVDVQSLSSLLAQRQPVAAVKAAPPSTPKVAANNVVSAFGALGGDNSAAVKLSSSRLAPPATPTSSTFLSLGKNITNENALRSDEQNNEVSFTIKRSSPLLSGRLPPSTPTPTATPSVLVGSDNIDAGNNVATFVVPQTAVMRTAEPLKGDATKSPFFGGFSPVTTSAAAALPARTSTVTFDASTKFGAASPSVSYPSFGQQALPPPTPTATAAATSASFSTSQPQQQQSLFGSNPSFMPSTPMTTAAATPQPAATAAAASPFGALLGFNLGGNTAAAAPATSSIFSAAPQQTMHSTAAATPAPAAVAPSPFSFSNNNSAFGGGGGGLFGSPQFTAAAASTPFYSNGAYVQPPAFNVTTTKSSLFSTPTTAAAAIPSFSLSGLASNFGKTFPTGNESHPPPAPAATTTTSSSLFGAGSFFAGGNSITAAASPFAPAPTAAVVNPFSNTNSAAPTFGSTNAFGGGFSTGGGGGGGAFGSKPVFGGIAGLFGTPPTNSNVFGSSSAFGGADSGKSTGPSFADIAAQAGQQPQPSVFGGNASFAPFGSTPGGTAPATGFGLFGNNTNSAPSGGLFGSPSNSFGGGNVFGQPATGVKVDTPAFGAAQAAAPSFSQYRG